MNGSFVTAKMAGMLSMAKTRSLHSTTSTTRMSGVKIRWPVTVWQVKRSPSYPGVMGRSFRARRTSGFFSGSISASSAVSIRMPVNTRIAPKT